MNPLFHTQPDELEKIPAASTRLKILESISRRSVVHSCAITLIKLGDEELCPSGEEVSVPR